MMDEVRLSLADPAEAAELREIYAPYVEGTVVSFELETPSVAEFEGRIREVLIKYPYLVARVGGRTAGYAYAHDQMERAAYQWNAELSIYLRADHTGRGLGTRLYQALMDILTLQNIHNVYGGISRPNPASEGLHRRLGFSKLGVYHRTGYKFGQWHDVVWYEKALRPHRGDPLPPIPMAGVDWASVLEKWGQGNRR